MLNRKKIPEYFLLVFPCNRLKKEKKKTGDSANFYIQAPAVQNIDVAPADLTECIMVSMPEPLMNENS